MGNLAAAVVRYDIVRADQHPHRGACWKAVLSLILQQSLLFADTHRTGGLPCEEHTLPDKVRNIDAGRITFRL